MATSSKRAYATLFVTQVCYSQSPWPCGRLLLTCASTGVTETLKGRSGSVSVWPLGPGAHKVLFAPSWHLLQAQGLILNMILALPPSCWGFFALGCGVSFFGGIQHFPVDGCSAMGCNFGVLAGDECTSFYSTVLRYVLLLCHLYNCSRFHQPPYLPCYSSIECYSLLQILSFLS